MRAVATAIAILAFSATPAGADSGRLADLVIGLSSQTPSSPTGVKVHVQFHRADDPDAKPSPIRTAVIALPAGLRFDSTAVPQCTASDDELHALGPDACPDDTELTVGTLTGMTGFGPPADPITGDNHVFNGPDQLIEVIAAQGSSASPAFDRLKIEGSTLTAHPPVTPGGPPDGETAVRSIDFEVPPRTTADGKSLITTPPSCPANLLWSSTGTFGFADGTSDVVPSTTPCTRAARRPAMSLHVEPGRVRAGRTVRLRFRVRSADPRCARNATVRAGGRTVSVGPSGRAALSLTFHKLGLRRTHATSPGCSAARQRVRVLPAR